MMTLLLLGCANIPAFGGNNSSNVSPIEKNEEPVVPEKQETSDQALEEHENTSVRNTVEMVEIQTLSPTEENYELANSAPDITTDNHESLDVTNSFSSSILMTNNTPASSQDYDQSSFIPNNTNSTIMSDTLDGSYLMASSPQESVQAIPGYDIRSEPVAHSATNDDTIDQFADTFNSTENRVEDPQIVQDFQGNKEAGILPVSASIASGLSDSIIRNPITYIVVLLLVILPMFAIIHWKRAKNNLTQAMISARDSVHEESEAIFIGKSNAYTSKTFTPIPLKDDTVQQEGMFEVQETEDPQISREFKIPSIPQESKNISGFVHWIPSEKEIVVHGHNIDGGMLYVGSKVQGTPDSSYIHTRKTVSNFSDYRTDLMGYWPNYSEISADARGAYLTWLASGKKDPRAKPGYVFLYFYGLERRILIDYPEGLVDDGEVHKIRCEVERLLSIYGKQSGSIRRYFSNFLNLILLIELSDKKLYNEPIPTFIFGGDIPFYLKVLFGQCANDKISLSAEMAYNWVLYDPLITKRTPVRRCTAEFTELFKLRYVNCFGEGILLPHNKSMLQASYHPASASLSGFPFNLPILQDLPDVTKLPSIRQKLQSLVDECTSDLDRYSRCIGKNGDSDKRNQSLTFLPADLLASTKENLLTEIKQLLNEKGSLVISVAEVLKNILGEDKPTKEVMQALAKTLEVMDIGMEPDVLAYQYELSIEDSIMLFLLSTTIPKDRTEGNYLINVLIVELADAVGRADGNLDDKEIEAIHQHLHTLQEVSAYQMMRLHKHQEFLQHFTLKESFIKKKLKAIPSNDIVKLLASVNHVVLADGVIDSSEIKFLERIYQYLGVDSSELYHYIQNPNEIGRMGKEEANGEIDFERVATLKQESAEISFILSEIFMDEESEENIETLPFVEDLREDQNPLGLDDSQFIFLTRLISRSIWTREELQSIADEHRLMLDGTLELINENAIDQFGIPVTEGDDTMEISEEFRGRTIW
jgi:uncharacterized tellurite resistance protein B-like protein